MDCIHNKMNQKTDRGLINTQESPLSLQALTANHIGCLFTRSVLTRISPRFLRVGLGDLVNRLMCAFRWEHGGVASLIMSTSHVGSSVMESSSALALGAIGHTQATPLVKGSRVEGRAPLIALEKCV